MCYSRSAVAALLVCIASNSLFAQEGVAHRTSLGIALPPAADSTPRYREDSGWDSSSYSNSHWAVQYGASLSAAPFIIVLEQPTRTNAALTANANQLTLDLAGGTYTVAPFFGNSKVQGGIVTVADTAGNGAFLRIANGTLNNAVNGNSVLNVGDASAVGRLFVQDATVTTITTRIGSSSPGASGFLVLETGGNFEAKKVLDVGSIADAGVTLSGANSTLTAGELTIGGATVAGVITLENATAVLHVTNVNLGQTGDLAIDNVIPGVPGRNAGLVVNAGSALIDGDLFLASKSSNRYGAIEINGGRVAVGGAVVYGADVGDTKGGKIFLNDGRLEFASPTGFAPKADKNFYWKNGTLAFTGATTSLTDAQIKTYTRQGATSYSGGRAEGTIAGGQTLEAAGTLTLSGNAITLAGGTVRAGNGLVVNSQIAGYGELDAVVSGNGAITNTTANELVIGALNGANAVTSAGDVTVGRSGLAGTYSGISSGIGRFSKEGAATQTISGSILNTGGADVTAGTLRFAGAGSRLQTSSVDISDGANLRLESHASGTATSASIGNSPAASASGRLDLVGTGTSFAVTGDVVNNGVIELTNGTLNVGGTLVNRGLLINNGSLTGSVSGAGVLSGSGDFDGTVFVGSGAMLAPGNSVGAVSFSDLSLDRGSTFELQIADAAGVAGTDWDLAVVNEGLSLAATPTDPVTILLKSLDTSFAAGMLKNFDPSQTWSWKFLAASILDPGDIDTKVFRIDATEFLALNAADGGSFSTVAAADGLYVNFAPQPAAVPEPGSLLLLSLVGTAAAGVTATRKRFRRSPRGDEKRLATPRR